MATPIRMFHALAVNRIGNSQAVKIYIQEVILLSVVQAASLCLLVVCQECRNPWNADLLYLPLLLENPRLIDEKPICTFS
jgi:hypothetical protein